MKQQRIEQRKRWCISALRARADIRNLLGLCRESIADYRKALIVCARQPVDILPTEIKIDMGVVMMVGRSDYKNARAVFAHVVRSVNRKRYPATFARALSALGILLNDIGEGKQALACHARALAVFQRIRDVRGCALTFYNIGYVYSDRDEMDTALYHYEKALRIYERLGDIRCIGEVYNDIGYLYRCRRDYRKALRYYNDSLSLLRRIEYKLGVSIVLDNIGVVHGCRGEHEKALHCNQQCLAISKEIGQPFGIAVAYNNLGNIYRRSGELTAALECFTTCVPLVEKIDYRQGIARAQFNIGSIYDAMGMYATALVYYTKAAALFRELRLSLPTGITYGAIGHGWGKRGDRVKAERFFAMAARTLTKRNAYGDLATVLSHQAEYCHDQHRDVRAKQLIKRACALADRSGNIDSQIHARRVAGLVYARCDLKKARQYIEESLALARRQNVPIEIAQALYVYAGILNAVGIRAGITRCLREARRIFATAGATRWLERLALREKGIR